MVAKIVSKGAFYCAGIFIVLLLLLGAQKIINLNAKPQINNVQPPKTEVLGEKIQNTPSPSPKAESGKPTNITSPVEAASPKKSRIKFGVAIESTANLSGQISSLESELGKPVSTISIFKQFGLASNNQLNLDDLAYVKSKGIKVLVAWEPWNPEQGMNQSTDYLKEIQEGKQDTYIKEFAQRVKNYGGKVVIRFGHEMNGNWYPWSNRPEEYKASYRRVVEIFRNEGVNNVTWMWSINNHPTANIDSFYPGSDVVQTIGIDGFNFGTTADFGGWQSFTQLFSPAYQVVTKYSKPVMISETASTEFGGDKALWVVAMFTSLPSGFPKMDEVIWFNVLKETDWRINSSQSSLEAFQKYLQ